MWKNWNPFKRRTEGIQNLNETSNGKENNGDMCVRGLNTQTESEDRSSSCVGRNGQSNEESVSNNDNHVENYGPRKANSHENLEDSRFSQSFHDDRSFSKGSNKKVRGFPGKTYRPVTSPMLPQDDRANVSLDSSPSSKHQNTNQSFSGVYGPLLSTPIVPKVRRVLESSAGLRSSQASTLTEGKPVGRSLSLNYGSRNPAKSTAGLVPWVRLKKRESITLSDIVSGNIPHSPNTVKLAAPEPRLLPMAPGFKTTPLIVTTESNRVRMVDTQTVVCALREKRKRFGAGQLEDSHSEESWVNAAKRRRQDSSQSNASSVSIPSMPESLPNLMGTPGVSLLHIENLKDQRPSTVPAMDAFVSQHQREFGLGGDLTGHKLQQQREEQSLRSKQSSRTVLRSIQSSLSSSLRARTNLSILEQGGVDVDRIRHNTDSGDVTRKMSVSSDVSMVDQSFDEPQPKVPSQTSTAARLSDTPTLPEQLTQVVSTAQDKNSETASKPVERKIADGVVLRRHNLSLASSGSPAKRAQAHSMSALVSTSDIEQDRQKEYKRRVLDLLGEDETVEKTGSTSSFVTTSAVSSASALPAVSSGFLASTAASSAATSAAVSASLDSLNKLVQSTGAILPPATSTGSVTAVTSASTLSQLLKSTNDVTTSSETALTTTEPTTASFSISGKPQSSMNTSQFTLGKEISSGFFNPITSSQNVSTESLATSIPSLGSGLKFDAGLTTAAAPLPTQGGSVAGGFQINFTAPATSSNISGGFTAFSVASTSVALSGSGQQTTSTGFNFKSGQQTTDTGFNIGSGQQTTSTGFNFKSGQQTTGTGFNIGSGQQTTSTGFNFGISAGSNSGPIGTPLSGSAFTGGTNPPPLGDSGVGVKDLNPAGSTAQNPTPNFTSAFSSAPVTSILATKSLSQDAGSVIFGGGLLQGSASQAGSSVLPSSVQSFTTVQQQQPREGSSAKVLASITQSQGFSFSSTASSTATTSTLASGMFNFGSSAPSKPLLSSGFTFGQAVTSTTSANSSFGGSSLPAPVGTTAAAAGGFSFKAAETATASTAAASQQASDFSFGLTTTNPLTSNPVGGFAASAGWTAQTSMGGLGSVPGQPASSIFNGFGGATATVSSSAVFTGTGVQSQSMFSPVTTAATVHSLFPSGGATAFGTSSQTSQHPFGSTAGAPAFSLFSTATATTTTSSAVFTFGQAPASSASAKPFTFGAFPTQPAASNVFVGGAMGGATVTTTSCVFGNIVSSLPAVGGAPSVFGSGPNSAFALSVSAPVATPAFGPATTTSMFGAMKSSSSVFGATTPLGGQSSSVFAAPATSAHQLFTFGAASGTGTLPTPQQTPAFGSNPTTAFGGGSSAAGSSLFAAKPVAPAFGGVGATSPPVFGAATLSSSTTTTPAFGTNFGSSNPFGAAQNTEKSSFGNIGSGFGSSGVPAFGTPSQNSVFGSVSQNPPANIFGSAPQNSATNIFGSTPQKLPTNIFGSPSQNPPPAFVSQQGLTQNPNPNPFGGASSGKADVFSAVKPNSFGATATTQSGFNFSAAQPQMAGSFGSQTGSGFNFGQSGSQSAAGANAGFSFTAQPTTRPAFQAPSATGFNFAAAAGSTPTFNFSNTPSATNPFSPATPTAAPRPRAAARRPPRRAGLRR